MWHLKNKQIRNTLTNMDNRMLVTIGKHERSDERGKENKEENYKVS